MPIEGVIKTLYSNPEKTTPVFPTTKVKAISDEDGKRLDKILEDKYATKNFVRTEITNAQIGGGDGDVNLDGYATEDYVDGAIREIDFPVDSVNGQTGAIQLNADDVGATHASHATDKNNPHGVTAEQVGARPDSWTPTAEEIGALGFVGNISDYDYDFNKCIKEGYYQINSLECTNGPAKGFGTLFVMHNIYATQVFFVRGGQVWLRNETDFERLISSSWSRVDSKDSAPAGYGLGSDSKYVSDINYAVKNGWYYSNPSTLNIPDGMTGYADIFVKTRTDAIAQYIRNVINNTCLVRYKEDANANWIVEWENPPMIPGVLYRTTKRCEGKPVYAIRVDCGALPNDTVTNAPLNMSVAEYGADVKLVGIDYTVKHPDTAKPHHIGNPSYIDGVPMNCCLYSNGALYYCRFQTHGDLSAYTAVATLELILGVDVNGESD